MLQLNTNVHMDLDTPVEPVKSRDIMAINIGDSMGTAHVTLFFPEEREACLAVTDTLMQAINAIRDRVSQPTLVTLHGGMSASEPIEERGN
jgi:hypothetical protein